jgi:hypothetical protein
MVKPVRQTKRKRVTALEIELLFELLRSATAKGPA